MKLVVVGVRLFLGLVFVVFGLNGFFHFVEPPAMEDAATALITVFVATGYLMPVVKLTELVSGLMILSGKFVPLGLTLLAPVSINIVLLHLFLNRGGLGSSLVLLVLHLFLAWAYRDSFRGVLEANAKPVSQG